MMRTPRHTCILQSGVAAANILLSILIIRSEYRYELFVNVFIRLCIIFTYITLISFRKSSYFLVYSTAMENT